MNAFDSGWLVVKGYEAPTMTSAGEKWLGEKQHTLLEGEQPIRSFRNLRPYWKDRPMMSLQTKLRKPDGKMRGYTTLATSSTIPMDAFAEFNINRRAQAKAWEEGVRNKHGYVQGMTSRDIIDQMLFDQANPQDLMDYDLEYDKRGNPVVLDQEGQPAPLASYWPYDYKDGERVPNKFGGFVLTQQEDKNDHPSHGVRMLIPDDSRVVGEVSVITPYGAAFPNMDMDTLMSEIGGEVVA